MASLYVWLTAMQAAKQINIYTRHKDVVSFIYMAALLVTLVIPGLGFGVRARVHLNKTHYHMDGIKRRAIVPSRETCRNAVNIYSIIAGQRANRTYDLGVVVQRPFATPRRTSMGRGQLIRHITSHFRVVPAPRGQICAHAEPMAGVTPQNQLSVALGCSHYYIYALGCDPK